MWPALPGPQARAVSACSLCLLSLRLLLSVLVLLIVVGNAGSAAALPVSAASVHVQRCSAFLIKGMRAMPHRDTDAGTAVAALSWRSRRSALQVSVTRHSSCRGPAAVLTAVDAAAARPCMGAP